MATPEKDERVSADTDEGFTALFNEDGTLSPTPAPHLVLGEATAEE